jgi:hypothetical protein
MENKHLLKSKTFWVNALTAVTMYGGLLPANKYAVAGLGVANIILRLLTDTPVTVKSKAE